ncbi:hypothetical protein [Ruegeria atlantica]|uniref:hypothetical protein n=1 Tax=Ruegeria atlantica TaxID=81569 RepID=UPI001480378D|nr:hypothetical protein [Ruegeria atlantica]
MEKPTIKWQRARSAALEGAHRRVFEPIGKCLFNGTTVAVFSLFSVYCLHSLFPYQGDEISWWQAIQSVVAGLSMLAILFFTLFACPVALLDWRFRRELSDRI